MKRRHVHIHIHDRVALDETPEDIMMEVNREVSTVSSQLDMVRVGPGVNPKAVQRGLEQVINRLRKAMSRLSSLPHA